MKTLDCTGLACPKPVIMTKKEFESNELMELMVIVDNEAASINVTKFAANIGIDAVIEKKDGLYHIALKRNLDNNGNVRGVTKDSTVQCQVMDISGKEIVILVSSDTLGSGDDKLGAALMKSYMYALTESENKPTTMMFLNGGVRLACEGADTLESIKLLEAQGTEVLSCGTCLDFYGLKEKLSVGTITNMYTIIEKMHHATNTIKL